MAARLHLWQLKHAVFTYGTVKKHATLTFNNRTSVSHNNLEPLDVPAEVVELTGELRSGQGICTE